MKIELTKIRNEFLPGPLFSLIEKYDTEENPFRKVHRLIDAFEWAVKWHTVIAVSDLLKASNIPDKIKAMLASGLRSPSLGIWMMFYREALAANDRPTIPLKEWDRLIKLEKKNNIIAFRNSYAHGATPDDEKCKIDINRLLPVFKELISSKIFITLKLLISDPKGNYTLQGSKKIHQSNELTLGHAAVLSENNNLISIWPLAIYAKNSFKEDEWDFFYFNSIKGKKIEELNYEFSVLQREKILWEPFHAYFPLKEWNRIDSPELNKFRSRIDALTEGFKGRINERKQIKEFCLNQEGTLFIWGVPGIGKSALIAQVFKEMKAGITMEGETDEDRYPDMIEYFIKRGTGNDNETVFLKYLNERIDSIYKVQGIPLGNNSEEMAENLQKRFEIVSKKENCKLVILIDGLDEFSSLRKYIPQSRSWLKIIISSRKTEDIIDWKRTRDSERRNEIEIQALSKEDIRAILYDVVNKYQDDFNETFIKAVEDKSQGNPLYLKLLCDSLFDGKGVIKNIDQLPTGINNLYHDTIKRITEHGNNQIVLNILHLLSEAKTTLSVTLITEFLYRIVDNMNTQQVLTALDKCREVLLENTDAKDIEKYQLFHESLREWLKSNHSRECGNVAEKISDICFNYQQLENREILEYALRYSAQHLSDIDDHERLWYILQDEKFRKLQIDTFKLYQPALNSLKIGIEFYIDRSGKEDSDDPRLCWLALKAGMIAEKAKNDISIAFDWARKRPLDDSNRIKDALQRLDVLDVENYYRACILLLLNEIEKQEITNIKNIKPVKQIIYSLKQKIPDNSDFIDWSAYFSAEFISLLAYRINKLFPKIKDFTFLRYTSKIEEYVVSLLRLSLEDEITNKEILINISKSTIIELNSNYLKIKCWLIVLQYMQLTNREKNSGEVFKEITTLLHLLGENSQKGFCSEISKSVLSLTNEIVEFKDKEILVTFLNKLLEILSEYIFDYRTTKKIAQELLCLLNEMSSNYVYQVIEIVLKIVALIEYNGDKCEIIFKLNQFLMNKFDNFNKISVLEKIGDIIENIDLNDSGASKEGLRYKAILIIQIAELYYKCGFKLKAENYYQKMDNIIDGLHERWDDIEKERYLNMKTKSLEKLEIK